MNCVCVCKCGLNESECNSKQKWNHDKRQYTCKKLDDYDYCKDDYILNPSTQDYECNKACKIDKYSDFKNYLCQTCICGTLVITCKDEILNRTKTSIVVKKK